MKLIRFLYHKTISWGIIEGDNVQLLKQAPYERVVYSKKIVPFKSIKLLVPATPSKIVLAGLNYQDHAKELKMKIPKEPVIFLKPVSALIADKEKILYPKNVKRLDYEAELAIVVGKYAKNISKKQVNNHILGFTCLNDVTARDLQKRDGQWTRAKSFDTFCPVGPCCETELNTDDLKIATYLNGRVRQSSSTKQFIFSIEYLFSYISQIMALSPGDIISTGTPAGIGPMKNGDLVEVSIEGIGSIKNKILKKGGGT
jgi:2-keto-4-pentenoate hydratase/2-oxohepta-3-ene-1,7-dioic acid hydratase in catechol pathway